MAGDVFLDAFFSDRRLALLRDRRLVPHLSSPFYRKLAALVSEIFDGAAVGGDEAARRYLEFAQYYTSDLHFFQQTMHYPAASGQQRSVDPETYHAALLASTIMVWHRFRIFELFDTAFVSCRKAAVLGYGTGLEIRLAADRAAAITGFDCLETKYNSHLDRLPNVRRCRDEFESDEGFDTVVVIEFLEHLPAPLEFLRGAASRMTSGSRLIGTTAVNVPQFDHLANFDGSEIAGFADACGWQIVFFEEIPHQYSEVTISAKNQFFVLEKK